MVDTSSSLISKKSTHGIASGSRGSLESASPFSRRILIDLVTLTDLILLVTTAYIAKYIYIDTYLQSPELFSKYFPPILYCVGCFYAVMNYRRQYSSEAIFSLPHRIFSLARTGLIAFSLVFIILFFAKTSDTYSRGWFLTWFLTFTATFGASRLVWSQYLKSLINKGVFQKRIAIIGSGQPLERLLSEFDYDNKEYRLALLCNLEKDCDFSHDQCDRAEKCTDIDALIAEGQGNRFDQVIIALPAGEKENLEKIVKTLRLLPIDIQIIPDLGGADIPLVNLEKVGTLNVVNIETKPISDWGVFVKNVADYVIGTFALICFLPAMALIAIAIKLDSNGPVLYRQKRHGYNHKIITVLKFRTMKVMDESEEVVQAKRKDSRITKIGYILRKTSLDELPQLFNVLMGDMSLVGPRPHAIEHNTYYGQLVENYANRHRVKPGITGWAQIHGLRGGTEDHRLMEARVQRDLEYIQDWSIWLDLRILFLTPIYGFISKNAY